MFFIQCARQALPLLLMWILQTALALEWGVDVSYNGSTQNEDWGASSHLQVIGAQGYGLDIGYQYLNSLSYEAFNTNLTHNLSQYEASLLWQRGQQNFRFQAMAGAVFSYGVVQVNGQDVIKQGSPGYKIGAGVSVPMFTRFRFFAETDFQDWLGAEIPAHLNWRYGIRFTIGGNSIQPLSSREQAAAEQEAERIKTQAENPPVTIDPSVPEYVPGYLSQSLPPIIRQSDLCKCYPAGPYTLQLGEFSNMSQAIRALEYRGLRQFFNSRSYQKRPQPVFLAQSDGDEPVDLYLGELASVEQMQYWRYELRKNGIQAKLRKVIGTGGERISNPVVISVNEEALGLKPKYTAEEIRRMNSLPEEESQIANAVTSMEFSKKTIEEIIQEQEAFEASLEAQRMQMNKIEQSLTPVDSVLQIGPLTLERLQTILASASMKQVLSRSSHIQVPTRITFVWDEGHHEGWLTFDEFISEQHIDEWQAWFNASEFSVRRSVQPYQPIGDVYEFALAKPLEKYSVEIAREANIQIMLQQMRAPEVLWFQAYQRINEEPVETSLNWSETDQRFHLIVTNIMTEHEQQQIWSNLNAVGLLPGLAED